MDIPFIFQSSNNHVDTLFEVKHFPVIFLISGSCWNSVKTGVIERLVIFQHTVDGVKQFAHDGADGLQRFLAVIHKMLEVGSNMWVMLFGTQGRHVESRTNMAVAGLGQTRLFVDAFAGIEGAWVETCKLHPFAVGKAWRQQQKLPHERNGTGLGNALDAREQLEYTLKIGVFSDQG